MHNGILATLDEVIDFFDGGGGQGNTAIKPINLNTEEKKYLKVFLIEAMSGEDLKLTYPVIP